MPEGLLSVIGLLSLGYVLMLIEFFVPGGILGTLGLLAVAYGCYLAFELGTDWGLGAVGLSVGLTAVGVRVFLRSRLAKRMVLDVPEANTWKAAEAGLEAFIGRQGISLTLLRPAGMVEIDGERIDVVANSEFIPAGVQVQVCEVEGNRIVVETVETVEAIEAAAVDEAPALDETALDKTASDETAVDGA